MWMEFDRVSPLGDERGDIRNAQIVKAVFGAQGMNVALKDAMLCWGEDEDKPEASPCWFERSAYGIQPSAGAGARMNCFSSVRDW
ncbi:DUF4035 domain-containing protein [Escherichia coli]|nr:DUF4035 domain-containing protein [Escherichia coli]MCW7367951.1 DUF4035 domain-containing protein [Escherichia coli]